MDCIEMTWYGEQFETRPFRFSRNFVAIFYKCFVRNAKPIL